jgi:NAD(P)-dependent dehydrogenase (short-subunit alcohol dehydrogenase family)
MGMLDGKVAVITGAASGQGLASARRFAAEGARLALLDWDGAGLADTEKEMAGADVASWTVDLSDGAKVAEVCAAILARFGQVDVLFNNAGIGYSETGRFKMAGLIDTPPAAWNAILAINLNGPYHMLRGLLPAMLERGEGSIINNTSISAMIGIPGCDAYTASKGALLALTRAIAAEHGPRGIRANAIAPGSIATPMIQPLLDKAGVNNRLETIPLRRIGLAEEVADVALFLASDASRYVSGQVIAVDGGRTSI